MPSRQRVAGRLAGLSSTTLPLRTEFSRLELAEREVCLVRRRHRDPRWNGAVIGTLAAGGFVAWYAEGNDEGMPFGLISLGTLGGWAIDAMIESWEVVYRAPDYSTARSVRVAPLVARGRRGLAMTLRF